MRTVKPATTVANHMKLRRHENAGRSNHIAFHQAVQSGAYYQLSYTRAMRSRTEYIARDAVPEIRRQVANYKRFKELSDAWVDLGIEHSRLKIKAARET